MTPRATHLRIMAKVSHRYEADALLSGPGSAVVVERGLPRSLVMPCPDGCGDVLTINLDPRSGPAWRLYRERRGVSLYPSVWRESGCESHFIVWRSSIYWCGPDGDSELDDQNNELEERVATVLTHSFVPYTEIAEELSEIPWSVLVACERLAARGVAERGKGKQRGAFRKI
jgi:hypothetical protein